MLKPLVEVVDDEMETVEDLIKVLLQIPKDYLLHPLGQKCRMGVDHVHNCVYMDDASGVEEYTYNILEEAKETKEPTEVDVPKVKLDVYKPELYVLMGYSDICENGNDEPCFEGIFSTMESAKKYGNELLEEKEIHYYEIERPILDECCDE